jgi:hypothetical protein
VTFAGFADGMTVRLIGSYPPVRRNGRTANPGVAPVTVTASIVPLRIGRALVLTDAYLAHPERIVGHPPVPPHLPAGSWINPPENNPGEKETTAQ